MRSHSHTQHPRTTTTQAPGTSGRGEALGGAVVVRAATSSRGGGAPDASSSAGTGQVRAPRKKSKKLVDINGDVTKDLGNGMFQVKLENGVGVMAHLSGKIRQNRIKIVTGDKVTVELSPYDLTRGRLTYRFKPGEYERLQAEMEAAASGGGAGGQ